MIILSGSGTVGGGGGGGSAWVNKYGVNENATTHALTGTIYGLDNNGAGPALAVQVEPGKPPLTVNAGAGKATNLNADKLDGLDATGFAPRLWAKVRFDGTLLHGNGATSARREPAGAGFQYFVAFDRSVAACGYVATVGEDFAAYDPPGEIQAALATLPSQTDTVFVSIDAGTTTVARQFSLMVLC